jgi:hypothetical protein
MVTATRLYVKGTGSNQRSSARQIIAAQRPTSTALDQTIEFPGEMRDIFFKEGRYGVTFFIRSTISFFRFIPVLLDVRGYHCTCGEKVCGHVISAYRYQQEGEVA